MGDQLILTVVAVVGSLGGVALGGWLTARRDDMQWSREQRQRQEDALRGVCAAFVAAAIECRRLLEQLYYFQQIGRDAEILTFGEEYNHKSRDLHREAAQLRFLGSAVLIAAADDIVISVAHALQAVKRAETVSSSADVLADLSELDELKRAINALIDQARSNEGLGPGTGQLDRWTSR
ncbi:hypothetical protein [Streptomyces sp. NPDC090114]|uniref:hypothetical protein n=1 Tax=Streptomyces sp. NPDC090114 TaxID=3365950 RepID=UPI003815F7AD